MLKVRTPKFDFENVFPHWSPCIEFAQKWNAVAIVPVEVEPYVIKVLNKARPVLEKKAPELLEEVELFIAQEAQHYQQHVKFIRAIKEKYPKVGKDQKRLKDELQDILDKRSLKFNLAYIEGFESATGVINAVAWFEGFDDYREGANPDALALWDWHMAEEYEHREVCFKVFNALYGRGLWNSIVNGYFYRLYGVRFAMKHLGSHMGRMMYRLLKTDWEQMTPEEAEASKARLEEINKRHMRLVYKGLRKVISPFYDPKSKKPPRGVETAFPMFEPGGVYGKKAANA